MMIKFNSRAIGKTFFIDLVVILVIVAIVIIAFNKSHGQTIQTPDAIVNPEKIKACHNIEKGRLGKSYNELEHDKDGDGIIDVCDICVIDYGLISKDSDQREAEFKRKNVLLKQFFGVYANDVKSGDKPKLDSSIKQRPFDSDLSSSNDQDKDKDGIPNGCDFTFDKVTPKYFNSIDAAISKECNEMAERVVKAGSGGTTSPAFSANVVDSGYGYSSDYGYSSGYGYKICQLTLLI